MNRLKIADISFCEVESAILAQVRGGAVTFGGVTSDSAWQVSFDSDWNSSYVGYYYRNAGGIVAVAGSSYSGSASGAAAAAVGNPRYVYTYASAYAS